MYDMDGNGQIELAEMTKLVKSIFQMMNQTNAQRGHLNPVERARAVFRAMDKDGDGKVRKVWKQSPAHCSVCTPYCHSLLFKD